MNHHTEVAVTNDEEKGNLIPVNLTCCLLPCKHPQQLLVITLTTYRNLFCASTFSALTRWQLRVSDRKQINSYFTCYYGNIMTVCSWFVSHSLFILHSQYDMYFSLCNYDVIKDGFRAFYAKCIEHIHVVFYYIDMRHYMCSNHITHPYHIMYHMLFPSVISCRMQQHPHSSS